MNAMNKMKKSKKELMYLLQAEDFVLYETALYLDTHPNDKNAMEYYTSHKAVADSIRNEYEAMYGPLSIGYDGGDSWSWIKGPWPWEKEAN